MSVVHVCLKDTYVAPFAESDRILPNLQETCASDSELVGCRDHKRGAAALVQRLLQNRYETGRIPVPDDVQQEHIGGHPGRVHAACQVKSDNRRVAGA